MPQTQQLQVPQGQQPRGESPMVLGTPIGQWGGQGPLPSYIPLAGTTQGPAPPGHSAFPGAQAVPLAWPAMAQPQQSQAQHVPPVVTAGQFQQPQ